MTEKLLQFIWQFQYFNKTELTTTCQLPIRVAFPGYANINQGPDFTDAKIIIGNTFWAGTVELHCKTSDWRKHAHEQDQHYRNVILHVVWEHDTDVNDCPVLELSPLVPKVLLQRFHELMGTPSFIPCEKSIAATDPLTWANWKERLVVERLLRKTGSIGTDLEESKYHWEEVFWRKLSRSFGMKVNADSFESIARSLPLSFLNKLKPRPDQLEALLLGQGGLLENDWKEDYPRKLKNEYGFLRQKHDLAPITFPLYFLRMRPGNFPTLRLAQLAMLVHQSAHLFSKLKETDTIQTVRQWFDLAPGDYWDTHYRFDEVSASRPKRIGNFMTNSILINTAVPMLFAYGNYHQESRYSEKALKWLEEIPAEINRITRGFKEIGIANNTAFDSQALTELKTYYCDQRRCLNCAVGNSLLKKNT